MLASAFGSESMGQYVSRMLLKITRSCCGMKCRGRVAAHGLEVLLVYRCESD